MRTAAKPRLIVVAALAALSAAALAQWNIDENDNFGSAQSGSGVPGSSFGAAAGAAGAGFWNDMPYAGAPQQLYNTAGVLSAVICTGPSSGSGGGYNFPGNTGDFALLLNDGHFSFHDTWTFTNVPNGFYRVYTYAAYPSSTITSTAAVTVTGSTTTNPQYVFGPQPGNAFVLGQTHCIHDIDVTSGTFSITVDQVGSQAAFVNGFQILPVPEPASCLALFTGVALVRKSRRASRQ